MIKKYNEKLKQHFHDLFKLQKSPESLAMGFALGTLIAILPTFGFGILIGLLVILVFEKISKLSMLVSFAFWNPLLLAPLSVLSYKLGDILLGTEPIIDYKLTVLQNFFVFTKRYLLGNLIIAITFTVVSYFIIYYLAKKYNKEIPKVI